MSCFVYIIESEATGDLYKGITRDIAVRLADHNTGKSKFTSSGLPWKLVFLREFELQVDAMKEEKRLKKCNKKYLRWLINDSSNLIKKKD